MALFQDLGPTLDDLNEDEATVFFGEYYQRREFDLQEDPAPVAKKKAAKAARTKATKKGKQIAVTEEDLRLLRSMGLIS